MADQGTEGLLSSFLREKRLKAVKPYLRGRVLDFGCGSGALAGLVDSHMYLGVEIDPASLKIAKIKYPGHSFISEIPASNKFDTIVSLAVIEHVGNPTGFLQSLAKHLEDIPSARIVITTPHPAVDWVHDLGATMGLFSRHANEEHEALLDLHKLEVVGNKAGLQLDSYSRFLFGANQVAIYSKKVR